MRVILIEDVERLGKTGDVVTVKEGYARNYLIPQGLALWATSANLSKIAEEKKVEETRRERGLQKAKELAQNLTKVSCTVSVEADDNEKLFGSVTPAEIASALEQEGISIDKKKIIISEPIKTLGIYDIPVSLHPEIQAKIKVWIVRK